MKNRDRNICEYDNLENWHVKTCTFLLSYLELYSIISARNYIRWILIRDDVSNWQCVWYFKSAYLPPWKRKTQRYVKVYSNRMYPNRARDGRSDQRDRYTRSSVRIWNRFYARVICTTGYIFIELQIERAAGRLSGIFGKSRQKLSLADGTEDCSNARWQSR